MGKLSRRCRFLADGRRTEESWRELLSDRFVTDAVRQSLGNNDIYELEIAYELLTDQSAIEHARQAHLSLFNFSTGESRAAFAAQVIAAGCLAFHCRQPLTHAATQQIPIWASRAMGAADVQPFNISQFETTQTLIRHTVEYHSADPEVASAICAMALEFAGIEPGQVRCLKIPILLVDRLDNSGKLAWLFLQKLSSHCRCCFPAAQALLSTEIGADTLLGAQKAWEFASKSFDNDNDVRWWVEGTDSISGRSAEAAFAVGLSLLMRDAPYDSRCVVSAQLEDDGTLGAVNGITEAGHPKVVAAERLKHGSEAVHVVVAEGNRLAAADAAAWKLKSVDVTPCSHVDEALSIASHQIQQLQDFLSRQISWILEQASVRMERTVDSLEELNRLVVPMRVARGIRPENEEGESSESESSSVVGNEPETERQVVEWSAFIDDFHDRAIILGDPGFGKTTLLWQATVARCDAARASVLNGSQALTSLRFALFLPAARLAETLNASTPSMCDGAILRTIRTVYELPPQLEDFIAGKMTRGHCLICLDALDEVPDTRRLEEYLHTFVGRHAAASILLTSRLTGFREAPYPITDENQVELLPFSRAQMKAAVTAWFSPDEELTTTVWRQISRNERLHDVFRSPILLHLASQQISAARHKNQALPSWARRSELYQGFVEAALLHLQERTSTPITEMERFEFRSFLGQLALAMWNEDPRSTVWNRQDLYRLAKSSVAAGEYWGLKDRFAQLFDDLQDCGLVVPVSAGNPNSPLMFLHRTIGEYLAGEMVSRQINDRQQWETVEKNCWDPAWEQVILFSAGCLKQPDILLSVLGNPNATDANPHGDDFCRHRLMLAAQCLAEVTPCAAVSDASQEIAEQVIHQIRQLSPADVLPLATINALRVLFAIDATVLGGQLSEVVHRRIPTLERLLPQVGHAAHSNKLFDWLVDRLWNACVTRIDRPGQTKFPPQPIAKTLVSISNEIDLGRVIAPREEHEPTVVWRVLGSLLRAAKGESSCSIQVNAELLRSIGEAWMAADNSTSVGLRQAIENLPPLTPSDVAQSGVLDLCVQKLTAEATDSEVRAALTLLQSLGDAAGEDETVKKTLAAIEFSTGVRQIVALIDSMRTSLTEPRFYLRLEQSIRQKSNRETIGVEMYLALNAGHQQAWRNGLERLFETTRLAKSRFGSLLERAPNKALVEFTGRLLRSKSQRSVGLQATKTFIESLDKNDSAGSEDVSLIDSLIGDLLDNEQVIAFDHPETIKATRGHTDLSVRILYAPLFRLASRFRSNDSLVEYVVDLLQQSSDDEVDCTIESKACCLLASEQREYLRAVISERSMTAMAAHYPDLVQAMHGPGSLLLDSIANTISNSAISQVASAFSMLGNFTPGTVDDRFVERALELLHSSRASVRHAGTLALRNLNGSAVTPELAESLVASMRQESSPGDVTATAANLASVRPEYFLNPLLDIFLDAENSSREHAACVLPNLGDCLVESNRFPAVECLLTSADRNDVGTSLQVLTALLRSCSVERRDQLMNVLVEKADPAMLIRYKAAVNADEQFWGWLLGQLCHDDDRIVEFAHALLFQNTDSTPERQQRPFISWMLSRDAGDKTFHVRPPLNVDLSRFVARIANTAAQYGYRFFHVQDGSFVGRRYSQLTGVETTNRK